ncbi:MAG: hypothetical protein ACI4QR_04410 [Eubacteriales bacterium]
MKKASSIIVYLLFAFIILLPLGVILSACFGYEFELKNYPLFSVITALLVICAVVLCNKAENPVGNRIFTVLLVLVTPLSLINAVFYVFKCNRISVVSGMLICVGCCFYLTIKYSRPLVLKIIGLVLSALMLLPTGLFVFIALIFGDIGQNTVVKSLESPNGTYYAQVISSDQGALGGDTLVDVYENKDVNTFIFNISKTPLRLYQGDWGEFENMEIYWIDENCLVINSVEYTIK